MNSDRWAIVWVIFAIILLLIAVGIAVTGADAQQSTPQPNISVYLIDYGSEEKMRCAVLDWHYQYSLDCEWPHEVEDGTK